MDTNTKEALDEHLKSGQPSTDPDYLAWKERKILEALEESKDRSKMIPAERVWKELGVEY